MTFFDDAVQIVLEHEGGFNNTPSDSGGATNFGISLKFLKSYISGADHDLSRFDHDHNGFIDAADIRGLTKENAIYLYKNEFWDKYKYDEIKDFNIACKTLDLSVNMGAMQAHKVVQRAVRASTEVTLVEDGILGVKSFLAVNQSESRILVAAIKSEAAGFYRGLVVANPGYKTFLNGWLRRAYS